MPPRRDGAPTPTALSLFSGCGGTDHALNKAGFNIRWANDVWQPAVDTYRSNIPNATIEAGDIRDFRTFRRAQLLVGCYPCQGYSQGGKRVVDRPENFLYREFDRVLRAVLPRAFIVENVNGMSFGPNHDLLQNQLTRYRAAGYRVTWAVLDAKEYGLPQTRRRLFLVGIRSDLQAKYQFPEPTHGPGREKPYRGQREAIGRLPEPPDGSFCKEALHWYYLSRNRRRKWSEPSPCIVGHWRHVPLHPSSPKLDRVGPDEWKFASSRPARRLSYIECARLQGFPAKWKFEHGRERDRFQMIGNAVPPPLFSAVLRGLPDIWRR